MQCILNTGVIWTFQGKERRKKPCTKPQPFSLSQPRVSRLGTRREEQVSLETTGKVRTLPATRPTLPCPAKTQSSVHPKPKTGTSVPSRAKPTGPAAFCGTTTNTGILSTKTATFKGKTVDQCRNALPLLEYGDADNQTSDSLSSLVCPVPQSNTSSKTPTHLDVSKDLSTHLGGISLNSSKPAANAKDDGQSEANGHKTPFRTPHSHAAPQRVAVKTNSQTVQATPGVCKPDTGEWGDLMIRIFPDWCAI